MSLENKRFPTMKDLEKDIIFQHFLQICQIPRKTYLEQGISNYLFSWAKQRKLEVYQDEHWNLLIRKPASEGYEKRQGIILQAHMDMVCEKSPEVRHDFLKDPISLQLDGDFISTGNKTTLGADDGIGMALAMTILTEENLKHPPIDVIFTTAEEEDMSGALGVDSSWFCTNRVINLDNSVDHEIIAGSSGGKGVEMRLPVETILKPEGSHGYRITISGLTGGHSGEDIHKGLASANVLLGRLLSYMREKFSFYISEIRGGNFRLALAREASVVVAISPEDFSILQKSVAEFEHRIKTMYQETEKRIQIEIMEATTKTEVFSKQFSEKLTDTILLSPHGISEMFGGLGVLESSCNLGEIYRKEDSIFLITEIRATFEENREYLYEKIKVLAKHMGGRVREFSLYPSWIYQSHSKLQETAKKVYQELFQSSIKISVVHAGLECGCFSPKIKNMDAISIGPNTWNLHSPHEKLSISSTYKVYQFLIRLLEELD
ncbi:MAG: beta-Ala-His dipeptidase [Fusobacterium necrophorum]|nr:beta-Ala-His dipeptidase [Fusobacterium necrophorum]